MMFIIKNLLFTAIFFNLSNLIIANESCIFDTGKEGICIPIRQCKKEKDAIFFNPEFCSSDKSKICCERVTRERFGEEETTTTITTTTTTESINFQSYKSFEKFNMSNCGRVRKSRLGGNDSEADLFEFPWIALIGFDSGNNVEFYCGASLISEYYALTSADCLTMENKVQIRHDILTLRLGEHQKSTDKDCNENSNIPLTCADPVQDIEIHSSDIIIHPDYEPIKKLHDIALIRIKEPVKISQNNIKPICLPFNDNSANVPLKMTLSGFGRTNLDMEKSDVMIKANVRVIRNNRCEAALRRSYGNNTKITENQFCAGSSIDSCKGDSGSSIFLAGTINNINDLQFIQYGIVSFSHSLCASSSLPGVYTKIHPYLPWILSSIK